MQEILEKILANRDILKVQVQLPALMENITFRFPMIEITVICQTRGDPGQSSDIDYITKRYRSCTVVYANRFWQRIIFTFY